MDDYIREYVEKERSYQLYLEKKRKRRKEKKGKKTKAAVRPSGEKSEGRKCVVVNTEDILVALFEILSECVGWENAFEVRHEVMQMVADSTERHTGRRPHLRGERGKEKCSIS